MKTFKTLIAAAGLTTLAACGGYTEDQGKAADQFCECMENGAFGDFDIDFAECTISTQAEYGGEIMADEGWALALEEKCPDVAGKIVEE